MTRAILISLILMFSGVQLRSQVTGIVAEITQVHDGIAIPALAGYTTYRVYFTAANVDDFVSLVFGSTITAGVCPITTTNYGLSVQSGQVYQNAFGGCTPVFNCALCDFIPEVCFDSYYTLGADCANNPGNQFLSGVFAEGANFCNSFAAGNPIQTVEGGYFTVQDFDNGWIPCGHKILIAQFTTNGNWEFCASAQGQPCGIPGVANSFCANDLCVTNLDATVATSEDFTIALQNGPLCAGQLGIIEITDILPEIQDAGLTYQLFLNNNPVAGATGPGPYSNLGPGDYNVVATSTAGSCVPAGSCVYISNVITIEDTGILTATVDIDYTNVCSGQISLDVEIDGGLPPFTYSINAIDFQLSNLFTDIPCQNYTVTFEDDAGCQGTTPVNPVCSPAFDFSGLDVTINACNSVEPGTVSGVVTGGAGTLNGQLTGPETATYNGISPMTVNTTGLVPGNYTINVTDTYGCADQFDFEITQPAEFAVTLDSEDALCNGQCSGTGIATVSGGVGNITYTWNGVVGTATNSALCAGPNTLVVSDQGGCSQTLNFNIGQPTAIILTAPTTAVTCNGLSTGSIDATATGGTGAFVYNIGGANQASGSFAGLAAGPYTVTATDENLCTQTLQVTITQPAPIVLDATSTNVLCNGQNNGAINATVTGGAGTGSFTLTPGNTQANGFFTGLAPGQYTLVYTDANQCASAPANFDITEPTPLVVTLDSFENITCGDGCDGTIELEISGGTQPTETVWNSNPVLTGLGDLCVGPNTAVVTDDNGCTANFSRDLTGPPPIIISVIVDNTTCTGMCDGNVIVTTAGGQGEITLSFSGPCQNGLTEMCEGFCTVTATDTAGCSETEPITIGTDLVTDMVLTSFSSPVSCWNEQDGTGTVSVAGGNPPLSFQWNDPLNQTTQTAIGLPEETYSVVVTDVIGCTLTTSVTVEVTEGCFFIATVLTPNGDGMNDSWLIGGLDKFPRASVQVFNRWGQLLFDSQGYTVPWDGTNEGQKLPVADYYFIIDYAPDKDPILGTVTIKY